MKIIAVIPARYASTRFPAKLLQDLGGQSVILRTYNAALQTGLFDDVFVVTDAEEIEYEITKNGGKALRSIKEHQSGSDRIAECIEGMDVDVVVNVQGDEPFINHEALEMLVQVMKEDVNLTIDLASLMCPLEELDEIQNPNNVKVVTDDEHMAMYFSRSVIPFPREGNYDKVRYMKHIGIYAFRKKALLDFSTWKEGTLEQIEKLEQLRYLEKGKKIKMVETSHASIGIDTLEDLEKARHFLNTIK